MGLSIGFSIINVAYEKFSKFLEWAFKQRQFCGYAVVVLFEGRSETLE